MVYDPKMVRDEVASKDLDKKPALGGMEGGFGLASAEDQYNPKVLPKRYMDDEVADRIYKPNSPEFQAAFDKAAAKWLSRDCHRSQYGYPFRVGIELALENRHRSITFASFTCSGADLPGPVRRDGCPRGLQRPGRRQGAGAIRPIERPDLPWWRERPHPGY